MKNINHTRSSISDDIRNILCSIANMRRATLFPYTTLFRSIAGLPNVEVVMQAEVTGLEGHDGALAAIRWRQSGEERSEEHTSELQSRVDLVCRLLLEKKKALSIP